jgi:hypothetical protein
MSEPLHTFAVKDGKLFAQCKLCDFSVSGESEIDAFISFDDHVFQFHPDEATANANSDKAGG